MHSLRVIPDTQVPPGSWQQPVTGLGVGVEAAVAVGDTLGLDDAVGIGDAVAVGVAVVVGVGVGVGAFPTQYLPPVIK